MRDGVYAGAEVLGPLAQDYAIACDAAIDCAAIAEGLCECLFCSYCDGKGYGVREARIGIRTLNQRIERCKTACAAIMPELRKLNKRKGVDGWETKHPSACLAVLAFAERVRSKLERCYNPGPPPAGLFECQPPPFGYFVKLVSSEFEKLAKKLDFTNAKRDAEIVRLREKEKLTFGQIARRLRALNPTWVGRNNRTSYQVVKQAYLRYKKRLS